MLPLLRFLLSAFHLWEACATGHNDRCIRSTAKILIMLDLNYHVMPCDAIWSIRQEKQGCQRYFKASPLPPAPLHAGSYKSARSLALSYKSARSLYSTFQTSYRVSCCFAKCEVSAVCFFSCVYYCCSWEEKSANGWSLTRRLHKHISFYFLVSILFSATYALLICVHC